MGLDPATLGMLGMAGAGALQGVLSPGDNAVRYGTAADSSTSAENTLKKALGGTDDMIAHIQGLKPFDPGAQAMIQTPMKIGGGVLPGTFQSRGDLGWAQNEGAFPGGVLGGGQTPSDPGEEPIIPPPGGPPYEQYPSGGGPGDGQPGGAIPRMGGGQSSSAPQSFQDLLTPQPQQSQGGDMSSFLAAMRLLGGK